MKKTITVRFRGGFIFDLNVNRENFKIVMDALTHRNPKHKLEVISENGSLKIEFEIRDVLSYEVTN